MKIYRNTEYLAIDNVLLSCNDPSVGEDVEIPEMLGENKIISIGDGAYFGSWCMERLIIPETIEKIGESSFEKSKSLTEIIMKKLPKSIGNRAFAECPYLEKITVNNCKISHDDYLVLKNNCIAATNRHFVARKIPEFVLKSGILNALDYKGSEFIPDNIDILYCQLHKEALYQLIDEREKMKMAIDFVGGLRRGTELTNFITNKEKYSELSNYVEKTEENMDCYVRDSKDLHKKVNKVALCILNDKETKIQGDECIISYNIQIGCYYWQTAYKVVVDKKTYYIYVRNYLSSNPEFKYIKDVKCVVCNDNIVRDEDEIQKVYSKFKWLYNMQ